MPFFPKFLAAAVLATSLVGCTPDFGVTMAAAPPPVPAVIPVDAADAGRYSAVPDEGYTVPAVPVAEIPPEFLRQTVDYPTTEPIGTIVIDPSTKHLYLVTAANQALQYGIAVGRAGYGWSGEANITSRTTWPKWIPPYEMIDRRPELEKFRDVGQPGGLTNPLGARALYLTTNGVDYGYRIHGTPEWESIGHNASSGCIRMINQDVMDLYSRVPDGTHVVVLNDDGSFPSKLTVPPKPAAKKVTAKPAEPVDVPDLPDLPAAPPAPVYGPF